MGNATEQACTVDVDCPGVLKCYASDLSWTNGTSVCDCFSWYGKWGPACDKPASFFYVSVVLVAFSITGALALATLAIRDARLVSKHLGGLAASATNAASGFNTLALLSLAAWKLCYLAEFLVTIREDLLVVNSATGQKLWALMDYTAVMMVFLLTFSVLGMLNLSLMWVEVSRQSLRLSSATTRKMDIYRTFCTTAGIVVVVFNSALVALRMAFLAAAFAIPITLIISMLFVLGRRGMEKALQGNIDLSAASNPAMAERMQRTSASIRDCCNRTVVGALALVVACVLWLWLIFLDPNGGVPENTQLGVGCWPMLSYEAIPVAVLNILHTQYRYYHTNITGRLHARSAGTKRIATMNKSTRALSSAKVTSSLAAGTSVLSRGSTQRRLDSLRGERPRQSHGEQAVQST